MIFFWCANKQVTDHEQEIKFLVIVYITSLLSCQQINSICCDSNDLIISDFYLAEYDNKSRFVCIKGIEGDKIESKYLYTQQIHKFLNNNTIVEINFYHNLIREILPIAEIPTRKVIELEFGVLEILIYSSIKNENINQIIAKDILGGIMIKQVSNTNVCYIDTDQIYSVPKKLGYICATSFKGNGLKKILTIQIEDSSTRNMFDIMYSNRNDIYTYMDDGDIIQFQYGKSTKNIIRSFILIDSKSSDLEYKGWCGMGPRERSFDCIYINNHDL